MAREIKDENVQIGRLLQQASETEKVLQSEMVEPFDLTKNHISVFFIKVAIFVTAILLYLFLSKRKYLPKDFSNDRYF